MYWAKFHFTYNCTSVTVSLRIRYYQQKCNSDKTHPILPVQEIKQLSAISATEKKKKLPDFFIIFIDLIS